MMLMMKEMTLIVDMVMVMRDVLVVVMIMSLVSWKGTLMVVLMITMRKGDDGDSGSGVSDGDDAVDNIN